MKLGMFTSGYQYYPLEAAFQDAKRIGYDYIELWGRPRRAPQEFPTASWRPAWTRAPAPACGQ